MHGLNMTDIIKYPMMGRSSVFFVAVDGYRTSQSTVFDLAGVALPEGPVELLNTGGGVNCMPGFFGTITGGTVTLGT